VAAQETVALVLDEGSPVPETDGDVRELVVRLRGHVFQLGALVPPKAAVLRTAQKLSAAPLPEGFMPSRVHLRKLAVAVSELATAVPRREAAAPTKRRSLQLSRNAVRAVVFSVAPVVLVVAASVPRT
jgi:hypothetical protein